MLERALLLLLLFACWRPFSASAQVQDVLTSMVRITGTRGAATVRGSGFVVERMGNRVIVVTASHVIEGVSFEVGFHSSVDRFNVEAVLGMESGDPNGLAAFVVRGAPARVTALSFGTRNRPRPLDNLLLAGFPQRLPTALIKQRALFGRRGKLLQIDLPVGEGFSGGPVVRDGKVVGVVTGEDRQLTYAVNAIVAKEVLFGWSVNLEALPPSASVSLPPPCAGQTGKV